MEIKIGGIYWLTTNAPADKELVVTNDNHKYMDRKFRPTIVLQKVHQISNKEEIYLVAQFSSNKPDEKDNLEYIAIDDYLNTFENLEFHGYIIPINVRMALSSEFNKNKINQENHIESVLPNKLKELENKCLDLIKNMKREVVINDVKSGKFDNYSDKQWQELIDFIQFNQPEREVKGFYGAYNDKRNKR